MRDAADEAMPGIVEEAQQPQGQDLNYYTHYPRTILWLVRGGTLAVVDSDSETGRSEVDVSSFYIGKFPITNEQFEAFQPGFERLAASDSDSQPAVGISFDEALAFCFWYAEISRKPMRLPTEVEWEYACRATAVSPDRFDQGGGSADDSVWDASNSGGICPPLAEKRANDFGLYGMLGGVWEWTSTEARAARGDRRRILKGGSFRTQRSRIDCSALREERPDLQQDDVGFRIVRSFP